MKALIVYACLLPAVFFCGCRSNVIHRETSASSSVRAARAFKGVELYSWWSDGAWRFALLPGTNGMKPEWMIKAAPLTIAEVERRFGDYAEGESVFWVTDQGFARPAPAIVRQLQAAAEKSKLYLAVP